MRDRIRSALGTVRYPTFLFYLMGPYTSFDVDALLPESTTDVAGLLPAAAADEAAIDEMLATLRRIQGDLRTDPGVNAFLAIDPGIPLAEMDAATQSIRFARASNAVAFVVPRLGDHFGVGLEVGAVLEDRSLDGDRLFVVHERDVTSAMLDAVTRRWNARIATYSDEAELVAVLRQFVAQIMYCEATGQLSPKGTAPPDRPGDEGR